MYLGVFHDAGHDGDVGFELALRADAVGALRARYVPKKKAKRDAFHVEKSPIFLYEKENLYKV